MIKNKQLIVNSKTGDCMRACITSILNIPNTDKLPNFTEKTKEGHHNAGWPKWYKLLNEMGLDFRYDEKQIWRSGYWIASIQSKNYKGSYHAVVMKGHEIAHDPSTKKRYRTGTNLLGKKVVNGGYWIEITDVSLLPRFYEFQKNLMTIKELKKILWKK